MNEILFFSLLCVSVPLLPARIFLCAKKESENGRSWWNYGTFSSCQISLRQAEETPAHIRRQTLKL